MRFREKISHFREIYKRLYELESENNKLRFEVENLNLRVKTLEIRQEKIREEIGVQVRKNMNERVYVTRIEPDGKYLVSSPKEGGEE
jgi:regulator of replication initiation timing